MTTSLNKANHVPFDTFHYKIAHTFPHEFQLAYHQLSI